MIALAEEIYWNRKELVADVHRRYEDLLRPCARALDHFLGELFSGPFPADWRERWQAFVDEWRPTGRMNDAASLREFEVWMEAWAMFCGLLPDDGRYRMVQEGGMWVAHRVGGTAERATTPSREFGTRRTSAQLAAYHPPQTSDQGKSGEPASQQSQPAPPNRLDDTERAGPGPGTTKSFRDKVQLALLVLHPKVAQWWKAPSVSGDVRSRDATSWSVAWRANYFSEMNGGQPIVTVDMHFTAGQTAQAIIAEAEGGWFAGSIGAFYRNYRLGRNPSFEEFRKWQQGAVVEAARLASVLAELYYNSIASLTPGGDLLLTVGEITEEGRPRWEHLISLLPLLGHLPVGAIILKLGKRTIKLPKVLVSKLNKLSDRGRKALFEYVETFAKSDDGAKAIIEREIRRGEATTFRGGYRATLGTSSSKNYRATFLKAHPELKGEKIHIHHAIEQGVLDRYPGVLSSSEMHSLENLRGIAESNNPKTHLSAIRVEWNRFYESHPTATKDQLLAMATQIDLKFASQYLPPIN